MRCPKCHYLSFDPEPRCKNCGYGFMSADSDLLISMSNDAGPLADLNLRAAPDPGPAPPAAPVSMPAHMRTAERAEQKTAPERPTVSAAPTAELPLFVRGMPAPGTGDDDAPLVKVPAEPRQPLSVRRKAPEAAPARTRVPSRKPGPLDRDLLEDLQRIEKSERRESVGDIRRAADASASAFDFGVVGKGKRLGAAALDALFLGSISAIVLWVTLRWCDLSFEQAAVLPIGPTTAFLLLVGFGYLAMFTSAGGQTIGKMAVGIRVVSDDPDDTPDHQLSTRQALLRALLTLPSVLAFGAGLVLVLFGDERALHDRLSHTRVVRA